MNKKVEKLVIEGITYVPEETVPAPPITGDVRIVVLQRGWVAIGQFKRTEGGEGVLYPAAVIRTWGTTKGLPELVNGPTSQTKLDKSEAPIRFNMGSEILMIDVYQSKWEKHL